MNLSRHSTTKEIKKRVPMFCAVLILAGMIALNVFVPAPEPQADTVHPFVYTNVTWLQTFHSGAWGDAE